jgi:UDP-N-acetylmuramoyl-tripeptide--D-alanyl-D-alanine ligase
MKKQIRKIIEAILTTCAQLIIWRHQPKVIAVTGSAGKTTTKYIIGSVLEAGFGDKVLIGHGNLATLTGVPLALVGLRVSDFNPLVWILILPWVALKTILIMVWPFYYSHVVLEVAADLPGGIDIISRYLKPLVSVVTNVGPAHLEYFKTVEGVAREKACLVVHTRPEGLVVLNGDDPLVVKMANQTQAEVKLLHEKADTFARVAATTIGNWLGLSQEVIDHGLANIELPKSRLDILTGKSDTTIIDSTYNANPVSMKAALEKLGSFEGRKIAVLGDMLELGPDAKKYHQEIGVLARANADYVIGIGPLSENMISDFWTESRTAALKHLLEVIRPGDTILIKASHGMHLEEIVTEMKEGKK